MLTKVSSPTPIRISNLCIKNKPHCFDTELDLTIHRFLTTFRLPQTGLILVSFNSILLVFIGMAKRSTRIRTSSGIPFVPEVFYASHSEPMPIEPPNTSYLTAMPEVQTRLTDASDEEKQSESRWKPLIGTPSKPPIPQNIFVPDPSPSRDFADDESPRLLTPSIPGSFIHRRRQGEYISRPPVWKIYNLPTSFASLPNELEDTDTVTCGPDEDVFTDFRSCNVSYTSLVGMSAAEQVRKMAKIFSDIPQLVNTTESTDQMVAHSTLDDPCLRFSLAADFVV